MIPEFPQGVFFVDLSPLQQPDHVIPVLATVLGILDVRGFDLPSFDRVREFLKARKMLLLLDNFEHLPDAAVSVARLIADCAHVTFLVTSREALRLQASTSTCLRPSDSPRALMDRGRFGQTKRCVFSSTGRMPLDTLLP